MQSVPRISCRKVQLLNVIKYEKNMTLQKMVTFIYLLQLSFNELTEIETAFSKDFHSK